jgi:hypothetical protein
MRLAARILGSYDELRRKILGRTATPSARTGLRSSRNFSRRRDGRGRVDAVRNDLRRYLCVVIGQERIIGPRHSGSFLPFRTHVVGVYRVDGVRVRIFDSRRLRLRPNFKKFQFWKRDHSRRDHGLVGVPGDERPLFVCSAHFVMRGAVRFRFGRRDNRSIAITQTCATVMRRRDGDYRG